MVGALTNLSFVRLPRAKWGCGLFAGCLFGYGKPVFCVAQHSPLSLHNEPLNFIRTKKSSGFYYDCHTLVVDYWIAGWYTREVSVREICNKNESRNLICLLSSSQLANIRVLYYCLFILGFFFVCSIHTHIWFNDLILFSTKSDLHSTSLIITWTY